MLALADFTSVQDAIDAASSGDDVRIAAGTYLEGIDLDGKDLTLAGAGSATTSIGGAGVDVCLTLTGGETLAASSLGFGACDTLVSASGATVTLPTWTSGGRTTAAPGTAST